jgi:uncharacterized protein
MWVTWDPAKNQKNIKRHGISFEEAQFVFDDPYSFMEPDRVVDGEQRWHTVGVIRGTLLIIVAHTYEEQDGKEHAHLISARKADKHERRAYES